MLQRGVTLDPRGLHEPLPGPGHTVNSGSEMVEAKHVSGKNIFWSTLTVKSRGGKIFEFVHCPFEGRANMHHKIQPN